MYKSHRCAGKVKANDKFIKTKFSNFYSRYILCKKRKGQCSVYPGSPDISVLFTLVFFPVLLTIQSPDTAGHLCCVPSPLHELCHLQPCDVWPPEPHLSAGRTIIMITHINYEL